MPGGWGNETDYRDIHRAPFFDGVGNGQSEGNLEWDANCARSLASWPLRKRRAQEKSENPPSTPRSSPTLMIMH